MLLTVRQLLGVAPNHTFLCKTNKFGVPYFHDAICWQRSCGECVELGKILYTIQVSLIKAVMFELLFSLPYRRLVLNVTIDHRLSQSPSTRGCSAPILPTQKRVGE